MKTTTTATPSRRQAQAKASKARVMQYRHDHHLRADGWVEPGKQILGLVMKDTRLEVAERLVRAAIRRVEFPSHGGGFPLNHANREEAMQAGMMAAVANGFFDHGFVTLKLARAIRSEIRGRRCLRLQCKAESLTDKIEIVAAEVCFLTEEEMPGPRLTPAQRDAARQVMADLRQARDISQSQKRQTAYQGHRNFFLEVLGHLTGKTERQRTNKSFSTRASRFVEFLKSSWQHDRDTRPAYRADLDILAAWNARS